MKKKKDRFIENTMTLIKMSLCMLIMTLFGGKVIEFYNLADKNVLNVILVSILSLLFLSGIILFALWIRIATFKFDPDDSSG